MALAELLKTSGLDHLSHFSTGQPPVSYRPAWRTSPTSSQQIQQTRYTSNNQYQSPQRLQQQQQQQQRFNYPIQQQYRHPQQRNSFNYNARTNEFPQAPLNIQKQVFQHPPPQPASNSQANSHHQLLQQLLNGRTFSKPKALSPPQSTTKQSSQSDFLNQFIGKSPASFGPSPTASSRSMSNLLSPRSSPDPQQMMRSFSAPRPAPPSR
ncbi:hypothetical protein ElyMa_004224400 [Elysia marginata]|uniref:Uncharacterized protein n=1 Tax=Elysia marginata TaxID=1093978 RepID=A0AAV4GP03_9GAST|nr:hypothetical protein ElyMa_004224400 [Elysia marginata]